MASGSARIDIDLVVPSCGRPSLERLLAALAPQRGAFGTVLVVDDRQRAGARPLAERFPFATVLDGPRRGPAAARNAGWRASTAGWVVFLDDDVVPGPSWADRLVRDLASVGRAVAASQGRVRVPLGAGRPTDWERNVAALEDAAWISADIAYRRAALEAAGGFDERFRRAYREDTDLAMRVLRGGWQIVRGAREVVHPVGEAGFWVSVERQRGNADDVLMRAVHGRHWRSWGRAPSGRMIRHLLTTATLATAAVAAVGRRRRTAAALASAWVGLTGELAVARIEPGPRDPAELARMLATSAVLPVAAGGWWAWGVLRLPWLLRGGAGPAVAAAPEPPQPEAVLLDRDGTLLFDVAYNGDPAKVAPMPGVLRALERLRSRGLRLAVISNQSGIGRGLIDAEQVSAVNRRAEELLGPVGPWLHCPHGPEQGCGCRKPKPGLVLEAAERLGISPDRCAVIGDIAADVQAAQAAGAAAVIVPTVRTEAEDVRMAPAAADSIEAAVERLLGAER
jgi:histidinol-phosphate phosphatase family protein